MDMSSQDTKVRTQSSSKDKKKKKVTVQKPKSRSRKTGPRSRSSTSGTTEKSPMPSEESHNTSMEENQHTVDEYFLPSPTSKTSEATTQPVLAEPTSPTIPAVSQADDMPSAMQNTGHVMTSPTASKTTQDTHQPSAKKKLGPKTLKNASKEGKPVKKNSTRGIKKNTKVVDKRQSGITDHFYVRRSGRKCASTVKEEEQRRIEEAILTGREDGLEVRNIPDKGRGIFSAKAFRKGEMVCEYAGELITYDEAKKREQKYQQRPDEFGCYMYYFNFRNKKYCVDATAESGRLGRLLNHSRTASNVMTKQTSIKDTPHLILVAARDISIGEELLYDYGERNKEAIDSHPWLNL